MRILVLVPGHEVGGAERATADLVACWRGTGHDVLVAGRHHPAAVAWGLDGVDVPGCSPEARRGGPAAAIALARLVRSWRPDVMYSIHRWPTLVARPAAWSGRVPLVHHVHANVRPRRATWWGDRTVVVSAAVAAHAVAAGADPGRVAVVPNGVDPTRLPPSAPLRRERDGELRVAVASRLVPGKGVDVLVRAVAALDAVRLDVVGDGPMRGALAELVRRLGAGDRVALHGWSANPTGWLGAADVVVVPSTGPEGLPLVAVEALAMGRPVVATRVGALADAVVDGVTGLLVPPGDLAALTAALRRLRDEPGLLDALVHEAASRRGAYDVAKPAATLLEEFARAVDDEVRRG